MSEFHIVLFARPEKGTYHWSVYNSTNNKMYHITNRSGSWKQEIREDYGAWTSKSAVTSVRIGSMDDKTFYSYFYYETIYKNDTCRTFIMRILQKTFNIDIKVYENYCIERANENVKNVERGGSCTRY